MRNHKAAVESPVWCQERGQIVVECRVHQPLGAPLGNICKLRQSNREKIERERHRLPVEIAAGDDVSLFRKDQGIVGDRVDFAADRVEDILYRVPACAVNLRDTADRIRVLHLAWNVLTRKAAAGE